MGSGGTLATNLKFTTDFLCVNSGDLILASDRVADYSTQLVRLAFTHFNVDSITFCGLPEEDSDVISDTAWSIGLNGCVKFDCSRSNCA